jgi:hypothetical protein
MLRPLTLFIDSVANQTLKSGTRDTVLNVFGALLLLEILPTTFGAAIAVFFLSHVGVPFSCLLLTIMSIALNSEVNAYNYSAPSAFFDLTRDLVCSD